MKKLIVMALLGSIFLGFYAWNNVNNYSTARNARDNVDNYSTDLNAQNDDNEFSRELNEFSMKLSDDNGSDDENLPDNELTIELLNKMSSWEELLETARPIAKSYQGTESNKEDWYCIKFIIELNTQTIDIYDDSFSIHNKLEEFGDIDKESLKSLKKKFKKIIDIYNSSSHFEGWS